MTPIEISARAECSECNPYIDTVVRLQRHTRQPGGTDWLEPKSPVPVRDARKEMMRI